MSQKSELSLPLLLKDLKSLTLVLLQHYVQKCESPRGTRPSSTANNAKQFCELFDEVHDLLQCIEPLIVHLEPTLDSYDAGGVKANGYRSVLGVCERCLQKLYAAVRQIYHSKDGFFFRPRQSINHLRDLTQLLTSAKRILEFLVCMQRFSSNYSLLLEPAALADPVAKSLLRTAQKIDKRGFYGRFAGFQYCPSMEVPMKTITIALATYWDVYSKEKRVQQVTQALRSASSYWYNPELRAENIVALSQKCDVAFCKSFWDLSESSLLTDLSSFMLPHLSVNHVFQVRPGVIRCPAADPTHEDITLDLGLKRPIQVRLMSSKRREGMQQLTQLSSVLSQGVSLQSSATLQWSSNSSNSNVTTASPYLIIHAHGGGFVSLTSRSHDVYLRGWARALDVPILTIDYSLAPEFTYPVALEECLQVYAWAIEHCSALGSTGEKILIVGDSAGGNLLMGTSIKLAHYGIRQPVAVVPIYTPFLIGFRPSPSRMLCLMDPLLPDAVLVNCLLAYLNIDPNSIKKKQTDENAGFFLGDDSCDGTSRSAQHDSSSSLSGSLKEKQDTELAKENVSLSNVPSSSGSSPKTRPSVNDGVILGQGLTSFGIHANRSKSLSQIASQSGASAFEVIDLSESGSQTGGQPEQEDSGTPWDLISDYKFPEDPFLSPLLASDQLLSRLPSVRIISCHLDPCLDDGIEMAKRLFRLKDNGQFPHKVTSEVIAGVPHGFLNFVMASEECKLASRQCLSTIRDALNMQPTNTAVAPETSSINTPAMSSRPNGTLAVNRIV